MMTKKILIAVGDCVHSKTAVRYAARVSAAAKDVRYTIFHVRPWVIGILRGAAATSPEVRAEVNKLVELDHETLECTGGFKDLMVDEGIPAEQIEVLSERIKTGMAKDILSRAERGRYDAIVMARTALTPSRDFFIGTISAKVVGQALTTPVWVVGESNTSMEFLLPVDGSENSMRDVVHVIDMVGPNSDLRLTLFHVLPYLRHYYRLAVEKESPNLQEMLHRVDEERMHKFYENVHWKLKVAGLKQSQINIKTDRGSHDIATAILQEAKRGGYGSVVVGRRGERDAYFTGHIAMRLVQKVTNQTLWVIP